MLSRSLSRVVLFALLSLASVAARSFAQGVRPINGVFDGAYECGGRMFTLRLAIVAMPDGSARGRFTFSQLPDGTVSGSFNVRGSYDAATNRFKLDPQSWNPPVPDGLSMVGAEGKLDPSTNQISGRLTGGCSPFTAKRNETESAKLPQAPIVAPKAGAPQLGMPSSR